MTRTGRRPTRARRPTACRERRGHQVRRTSDHQEDPGAGANGAEANSDEANSAGANGDEANGDEANGAGANGAAGGHQRDDGRAIIEVVFLAVLLLIPVVYILIAVLRLQGATLAVSQAARDVGRLIETSHSGGADPGTMSDVARQDLADQGISADGMLLRTTEAGGDCARADTLDPSYRPGSTYQVCVIAVVTLPGVPTILSGSKNTVTGIYTVHIGELREAP